MRGMGFRGGIRGAHGEVIAWSAAFVVSQANILRLLDHRDRITDRTIRATTAVSTAKWVFALGPSAYLVRGFARVRSGR